MNIQLTPAAPGSRCYDAVKDGVRLPGIVVAKMDDDTFRVVLDGSYVGTIADYSVHADFESHIKAARWIASKLTD